MPKYISCCTDLGINTLIYLSAAGELTRVVCGFSSSWYCCYMLHGDLPCLGDFAAIAESQIVKSICCCLVYHICWSFQLTMLLTSPPELPVLVILVHICMVPEWYACIRIVWCARWSFTKL